jgi:TonB family protein
MQFTIMHKLTGVCLLTGFSICGMIACNSDDYRSSDSKNSSDSSSISGGNINSADSAANAASKTAKAVHKKGKTSVIMPMGNKEKMVMDKEGVYNNAEVMPEFPGGQDALANYVNNHVEYPQQAIDDNTTGTVKVSFVIDENGKVTGAQLMNGNGAKIGKGLDEEALRVVNSMPAWKPGKVKGKNVKTRLELPITFQFEA